MHNDRYFEDQKPGLDDKLVSGSDSYSGSGWEYCDPGPSCHGQADIMVRTEYTEGPWRWNIKIKNNTDRFFRVVTVLMAISALVFYVLSARAPLVSSQQSYPAISNESGDTN